MSLKSALALMISSSLMAGHPSTAAGASPLKPSVVTFLIDDLDLQSFHTLLAQGKLPNIQTYLINRGVTFDNHYATNPVCAPSRATLLTGQYPKNHGIKNLAPGYIEAWIPKGVATPQGELTTMPVALQQRGYYTGHVGKYLNGYETSAPKEYIPPGYSFWAGLRGQRAYQVYGYEVNLNGRFLTFPKQDAFYQTDILAGMAEQFIASAGTAPLALTVAPIPPHFEVFPVKTITGIFESNGLDTNHFGETVRPAPRDEAAIAEFDDPASFDKPSFADYAGIADKPMYVTNKPPLTQDNMDDASLGYRQRLASMLAVDNLIGRVAVKLGARLASTYLVLVSDNGYLFGEHRLTSKLVAYEESAHIPLVIAGPGVKAGSRSDKLVTTNDIAPTIAALTGTTPPRVPDGRSLVPLLKSPDSAWARRQFLIEHYEDSPIPGATLDQSPALKDLYIKNQVFTYKAIRRIVPGQNLLYVEWYEDLYDKNKVTFQELYDMSADPFQLRNLALEPASKALRDSFRPVVGSFANCQGSSCVAAENASS